MSVNLMAASREWAVRPADERFDNLNDMYLATRKYADATKEREVKFSNMRAVVHPTHGLALQGSKETVATFTHYSFQQFCTRIGVPAAWVRQVPDQLAADNINFALGNSQDTAPQNALIHCNGKYTIRAFTSSKYERIWNHDLVELCQNLPSRGWKVPPARPAFANQPGTRPATAQDVMNMRESGLSVQIDDPIAPAGLYASNENMFIFMVNEDYSLEASPKERMSRGFFLSNSEVGDAYLKLTMFYYSYVCGNHIVWGAENVNTVKIKHIGGKARNYEGLVRHGVKQLAEQSAAGDGAKIQLAKMRILAPTKDEVIEMVSTKNGWVSKKQAAEAYTLADQYADIHGSPRSVWGYAAGLTRLSQRTIHADSRLVLDDAARLIINTVN